MQPNILYEDNHLIVAYKEAGILSQEDSSNKQDMLTIIKEYIKEKYHKSGNVYLGLVHRLDTNTSGVMVFAKTSKAAARLSLAIKNKELNKKYLAVVCKSLPISNDKVILTDYLEKNERTNTSFISSKNNGKKAELVYKVLNSNKDYSLLDIELITGRHHQIRVQFSTRGMPLYGDIKYGARKNDNFELGLQAYSLSFPHPITKELLKFEYISKRGIFNFLINNCNL